MIKIKSISEPKLVTDEKELRYINEILPLECKICDLEQENIKLQKKLDKAIELLIEYNIPCEMNDFMNKNVDYCMDNCSVDEEVYKKCWLRYIELELKKE